MEAGVTLEMKNSLKTVKVNALDTTCEILTATEAGPAVESMPHRTADELMKIEGTS